MALLILALLQRIFLMSSLMLLLVWLIFFMVLIKLLPILGTISGKTVKLMVLALICLGNNRQEHSFPAEPLFRSLAIDSTVDIFTFYVPHRHVYGEQWIKFMKDGVNATPLPTVNTTGYIDHAAFLGTINPDTNKIPKHLFQGYLNIYN